jgi:hypothetical protein
MLDLVVAGDLPRAGFVRQEDVPLATFLANRFGRVYAGGGSAQEQESAARDRVRLDAVA